MLTAYFDTSDGAYILGSTLQAASAACRPR